MPSELQMVTRTRVRLRHPMANQPSEGDCLIQVCTHKRNLTRHRRNTGNAWDYQSQVLTVDAAERDYGLSRDFGRPFAVLTRDDSNPAHIERSIRFFEAQNLAFDWGLPSDVGNYLLNPDGSYHTAVRVAFYWQSGDPFARFQPVPQLSCDYEIFYTPRTQFGESLASAPVDEADSDLIEIRAARALLPFAAWSDDEAMNHNRRLELASSLTADEELLTRQFEADVLITQGSKISTRPMPPE